MGQAHPLTIDVLRHLQVHGISSRSQVEAVLGKKLPGHTLSNLVMLGYAAVNREQHDPRYYITGRGQEKLRNPNAPRPRPDRLRPHPPYATARDHLVVGRDYIPRELVPSHRPGANTAASLPSRVGDRLYWPDGRTTDLSSNPL